MHVSFGTSMLVLTGWNCMFIVRKLSYYSKDTQLQNCNLKAHHHFNLLQVGEGSGWGLEEKLMQMSAELQVPKLTEKTSQND